MRTLILLLFSLSLFGQGANWKNFGPGQRLETAAKLCQGANGDIYYLANGDTNSFPGNKWQLYKMDALGNILWKKVYGERGNYFASQIIYHREKLYVVGERSWNDTDQAWVEILDTSGLSLQKSIFGNGDSTIIGQDIAINNQEELAILNQVRAQPGALQGASVLILDSMLNILHRHNQFDTVDFVAHEITALPFGGWVYTADYELPTRFDLLVTKINRQAQQVNRTIVSNGYTRGGNAIAMNSKHQIAIGGEGASAFSVSFDITLCLLDTNLNLLADVYVRPGVPKNDACFDMAISPYDTYLFTGYQINPENGHTEMIVVESDSAGTRLQIDKHASSPTCIGSGIVCDSQGNFVAAGSDFNLAPSLILATGNAKGLSLPIEEVQAQEVYPNPSAGDFIVEAYNGVPEDWKLFDAAGQEILMHWKGIKLAFTGPSGIYILQNQNSGQSYRLIRP